MEPVLELRNATLVRGGTRVLESLSLTIRRGEHTAILGPNGAGKTSLIRMLMLEDRPRATENGAPPLRLFGRETWDIAELRTRLGIVTGDLDAGFGIGTSGGRVAGSTRRCRACSAAMGCSRTTTSPTAMREQGRDRAGARRGAAPGGEAAQRNVGRRAPPRADRARADHASGRAAPG